MAEDFAECSTLVLSMLEHGKLQPEIQTVSQSLN